MTLARTALRLQAIEVLNADPVIGPACGGRIFDSRLAELSHLEPVPVIVVTTEETAGEGWSENNGGVPFDTSCDLVLEIAMNAVAQDEDGNSGLYIPATDSELEAGLDLYEEACIEAITAGETAAARLLRRLVITRVPKFKSARFATDDTGEKLAIRLVTFRVELKQPGASPLDTAPTGPFATVPEPLRSICAALPEGSSGHAICLAVAGQITAPADARLMRATVLVQPRAPMAPVNPLETAAGVEIDPAGFGWPEEP